MQKHLFVTLNQTNDHRTAYKALEDHIKKAVIRANPTGGHRNIDEVVAEFKITDDLISNTRTKEAYLLPLELTDALRSVKKISDLNAFVFRIPPEGDKTQ